MVYNIRMERTQIYLPKNQLKSLRTVALETNTNVSAVIRMYISKQLHPNKELAHSPKQISLVSASKKIGAIGSPGPKDLASNVDHYLYGK